MPRSIVYVWDGDYPWDVRTEKVTLALARAGHVVNIVARNKAWRQTTETLPEGTVHRMRPWKWAGKSLDGLLGFPAFFSPRWIKLIERTCRDANADLIIVRDLPLCPTALGVGKRLGIPVMLDMAENYPAMMRDRGEGTRSAIVDTFVRNPRLTEIVERYCITRVDWTLTVVEESSTRLESIGADALRMSVVSNTPPLSRVECTVRPSRPSSCTITVVYLGLLEAARGIGDLIDAMGILRDKYGPKFRAIVIGGGRDSGRFVAHARSAGLLDTVITFPGCLPHAEALRIVGTADVGVIPHHATESWNTTIPNKLFDYMAAGLPVVSSDTKPCARVILETRCGEVFRAGDAESLAHAIERASEQEARVQMAAAGRKAILECYNWEHDTATLMEGVAQTKKPSELNINLPATELAVDG